MKDGLPTALERKPSLVKDLREKNGFFILYLVKKKIPHATVALSELRLATETFN